MRTDRAVVGALLAACALSLPALGRAADRRAAGPFVLLKDGRKLSLAADRSAEVPVAVVAGEKIALRELAEGIAAAHEGRTEEAAAGKRDPQVILDRLVDLRLVVLEARAMGIDGLPEFKRQLEAFRTATLRDFFKQKVGDATKRDAKKVEASYRDAVREWKVRSLVFPAEEEARAFRARATGGAAFGELAKAAVAQQKAKGSGQPETFAESKMLTEVGAVLRKLAPGEVSPVVNVPDGFAVLQLEAEVIPENPEERARAEAGESINRHREALRRRYQQLLKRYCTVERGLLKKVDFDGAKGLPALLEDRRALVRIEGEAPVTVGDLARELQSTYYHGTQATSYTRKLNARKDGALESILLKRLFLKEAMAQGLQGSPAFRRRVAEFERTLLINATIERVVIPEVKVAEPEERAYYEEHKAEYTFPRFLRLEALAFARAQDAEAAIKKLRAGTDFKWYAANADGRLDPEATKLRFDGSAVAADGLGPDLARSLAGAMSGDYRLHSEGGEHYAVHVLEEIPPRPQPFEGVRAAISKAVFAQKLNQATKEWTGQLRQRYEVQILLAGMGD
jgi:hypothetical protein